MLITILIVSFAFYPNEGPAGCVLGSFSACRHPCAVRFDVLPLVVSQQTVFLPTQIYEVRIHHIFKSPRLMFTGFCFSASPSRGGWREVSTIISPRLYPNPSVTVPLSHSNETELFSRIPAGWPSMMRTPSDWQFNTTYVSSLPLPLLAT